MPLRLRRARFTLLELIITLAIFSALAGLGAYGGKRMVPRWHTRAMAYKVKADLERCRAIAIQHGNYCRMKILLYDNVLGTNNNSKGQYRIQWCNTTTGTQTYAAGNCWDTLPIDRPDSAGGAIGEGNVNFATAARRKASISGYGGNTGDPHNIAWPPPYDIFNDDSIVFDSYGAVINPVANYGEDGHLYIDIANKYAARVEDVLECYVVRVGIRGAKSGLITVTRADSACPLSVIP
jgi:prepilin-type N-terminal cleavage/methylation domain-containing protein